MRARMKINTTSKCTYVDRRPRKRILVKDITTQDRIDKATKAKSKRFSDVKAKIAAAFQELKAQGN